MNPLLIILGPTASGKTRLATRVADRLNGEIISADSRQVYRRMDIGTGKDLNEYVVDGRNVVYHLIDIREAGAQYNVNDYQTDFEKAVKDINTRSKVPVVCGGTGFYIHSVLKGHAYTSVPLNESLRVSLESLSNEALLDRFESNLTAYSALADTSTKKRLIRAIEISEYLLSNPQNGKVIGRVVEEYKAVIFGLDPEVPLRRKRISERLEHRLANGLIEEVQGLLATGLSADQLIYYGLEYKLVTLYLTGQMNLQEMKARLESDIHRFAKRQMTFFRKMERDGLIISWVDQTMPFAAQLDFVEHEYNRLKAEL